MRLGERERERKGFFVYLLDGKMVAKLAVVHSAYRCESTVFVQSSIPCTLPDTQNSPENYCQMERRFRHPRARWRALSSAICHRIIKIQWSWRLLHELLQAKSACFLCRSEPSRSKTLADRSACLATLKFELQGLKPASCRVGKITRERFWLRVLRGQMVPFVRATHTDVMQKSSGSAVKCTRVAEVCWVTFLENIELQGATPITSET